MSVSMTKTEPVNTTGWGDAKSELQTFLDGHAQIVRLAKTQMLVDGQIPTGQFCYFCGSALRQSKVDDHQVCNRCGAMFMNQEYLPPKEEAGNR